MKTILCAILLFAFSSLLTAADSVGLSSDKLATFTEPVFKDCKVGLGSSSMVASITPDYSVFSFYQADGSAWLTICRPQNQQPGNEVRASNEFVRAPAPQPFLPAETSIKSTRKPIVTETAEGWIVTFK